VTWQPLFKQCTVQLPEHSTMHEPTAAQVTSLLSPTRAAHSLASWQLNWQASPQMTAHVEVAEHSSEQAEPHDCVQPFPRSWH